MPQLASCGSVAHRAVIQLLTVAMGAPISAMLEKELRQAKPEQIAQIANQNTVHTVLHSAFEAHAALQKTIPADLRLYFQLMYEENATRNQQARQELALLGKAFQRASIPAVILKGGAEMLAPFYQDATHRYLSDLDILVPEARLKEAAEILFARGGVQNSEDADYFKEHHHIPVIEGGELPFRIELHRNIGDGLTHQVLSGAEILEKAVETDTDGMAVPTIEHRFIHHLLHSQLRNKLYDRSYLNLRDCIDHYHFSHAADTATKHRIHERLNSHALSPMLEGLDVLCEVMFRMPNEGEQRKAPSEKWAARALRNFGQPKRQKYADSWVWIKSYLTRFLKDPQRRKYYIKKLLTRRGWVQILSFHKERLKRFV